MNDINLRTWQAEFHDQLAQTPDDDFLLVACPAAGKTIAATVAAAQLMESRDANQVLVVAPTVVVRDQWQRTLETFGFAISPTLPSEGPLPPWVHGVCTTYAQAAYRADQFAEICENRRTIVICDEVHHASEQRTWGEGLQIAFSAAAFRLMLSGTPFRTDATPLPFITYDHRGDCIADFAYDYRRAVKEGVCRKVEFRSHDGLIRWSTGTNDETEAHFSDEIKTNEYPHRLRAALDPTQPYLRTVLERANEDLMTMRQSIPDAAGLVICDSQKHALDVDRLLNRIAGDVPTIAISDIPRSHQALADFSTETDPWLVSVRMVSEGVDIPRLGVVVWLTGSSTELMVRQVAGRALRGRSRYRDLPAIVHIPADPRLTRHAERLDLLAGVSIKERGRRDGTKHGPRARIGITPLSADASDQAPLVISPDIEQAPDAEDAVEEIPTTVTVPELPPSPAALQTAQDRRDHLRASIYRLLRVYTELRRDDDPTFQLAGAKQDLEAAVGPLPATDEDDGRLEDAQAWMNETTAKLALEKPGLVKDLARRRRRAQLAVEAA